MGFHLAPPHRGVCVGRLWRSVRPPPAAHSSGSVGFCHAIAMLLPCDCRVIAMLLPCYCHASAVLLKCYGHVIAMILPCYYCRPIIAVLLRASLQLCPVSLRCKWCCQDLEDTKPEVQHPSVAPPTTPPGAWPFWGTPNADCE